MESKKNCLKKVNLIDKNKTKMDIGKIVKKKL